LALMKMKMNAAHCQRAIQGMSVESKFQKSLTYLKEIAEEVDVHPLFLIQFELVELPPLIRGGLLLPELADEVFYGLWSG